MREAVLYGILLDPQKAYNALNRDRCLEILAGYGMGPWEIQTLRTYWGRLTMVAKAGRYHDTPFKGLCGVTYDNPLSPTII